MERLSSKASPAVGATGPRSISWVDPLSGEQFELSAGDYRATIASVGASLRELTWQGRHLVVPFDAHEIRPDYRGAVLAPWPNRVVDGKYQFDGLEHQLALTEPERGHALHGLVVWQDFTGAHVYAEKCTASQERVMSPRSAASMRGWGRASHGFPILITSRPGLPGSAKAFSTASLIVT